MLLIPCLFILSCSDFLDIVPDNIATVDHAFNNRTEAERYLYGCFSFLPAFANPSSNPALLGGDEVWYIELSDRRLWPIALGEQGTNDPFANYWSSIQSGANLRGGKALFTALSDCNIFLENIHKPYDLNDFERNRWIGEVKFLKAFYHFWLFRMYGPIPLIKENLPTSTTADEVQRYREPVDEVVEYIVSLLDEAAVALPPAIEDVMREMGRPTQVTALALKAQVLTYAASPLFNGNTDYAGYVDKRGIQLFPQTYRVEKWRRAADALKAAIDTAITVKHTLYDFRTSSSYASVLNDKTILAMQVRGAATERWNPEIIWGDSNTNVEFLQRSCTPFFTENHSGGGGGFKTWAPPLHMVEQFYTKNGLPIEEDKDWVGTDLMGLRTATPDERWYIKQGFQTINLHFDREARFYGSICFDGGTFYGNSRISNDNTTNKDYMWVTELKLGTVGGMIGSLERYSSTSYICKKPIHYLTSVADNGSSYSSYRYAFPIIRLADLYLMYAEALNECGGETPDSEVYDYIDRVRARTGLPGVVESWSNHAIDAKKNKPLTKDGMREIIRRERLNELAFEGIRFWDLRRWKLAEEYMNKPIRGLNVWGKTADEYYQITELYQLKFEKKDYFWPVKVSTLMNNQNTLQSPGW
ncbi:MAG: RagB/SusD family nutrient uptake outer membrane protein [Mangrovibacterium sp.]